MRIIHLARKPFEGTVVGNVTVHGTGGLHIDASRISTNGEFVAPGSVANPENRKGTVGSDFGITRSDTEEFQSAQMASIEITNRLGRFPSNVVLEHLPGCECLGTGAVQGRGPKTSAVGLGRNEYHSHGIYRGTGSVITTAYVSEDGTEPVMVWRCVPGCPVDELEDLTGTMTPDENGLKGGTSRFYKQVKP